jgi:transcriptional antiterminator NusG
MSDGGLIRQPHDLPDRPRDAAAYRVDDVRQNGAQALAAGPAWFAVLTRSRHERKVRDQLLQAGLEVFLPTTHRWSRWRDRRKRIEWPLFPGYCFVRLAPKEILPALSVGGSRVITIGGQPAPIPDCEIDAIRRLVATTLPYETWPFMNEGMPVEIIRGPLAGARGRFVRKGSDFRVLLAIELLGRMLSVQIDAADVERL